MLIYCGKYGHKVETKAKSMCLNCIFWLTGINQLGHKYEKCDYDNFYPGLKKGRIWTSKEIKS